MLDASEMCNNIIDYKRKLKKMSRSSKKKAIAQSALPSSMTGNEQSGASGSTGTGVQTGEKEENRHIGKIIAEVLGAVVALLTIIGLTVTATMYISGHFTSQGKDIESLQDDVTEIKESIGEMKKDNDDIRDTISELKTLVEDDHKIFLELASISTDEKTYRVAFKDVFKPNMVIVQNEIYLAPPSWESEDSIARDTDSDKIYNPEDLYNTPIITSYMEGNDEVYFYGRFNENNQWNGKCLLNVYNENKLVYVFEGIYDKGTLFSYRRVLNNGDTWIINDRVCQEGYNSGETWTYNKSEDFMKDFTKENVKEKQILSVEQFLNSKPEVLLSYYYGNTANGLYNDNTGQAYLVTYFNNGEIEGISKERIIKTLYQGCFLNGTFEDETGDAWYITRKIDTTYMYYEGSFSNGTADHIIEIDRQNPIGYEFISNKLKEKGFEKYELDFWAEYDDSMTGTIGN